MSGAGLDLIDMGVILLVIMTISVAMFFLFLVWRNGYSRGWQSARKIEPRCPSCRYSMKGLSHCRCPECGREFVLEELWRSYIIAVQNDEKTIVDEQVEEPI